MFKISDPAQIYKRVVQIKVPQSEPGKDDTQSFTAHFKLLTTSDFREALKSISEQDSDYAFIKQVLVGWEGIHTHDDKPVAFNEQNLQSLCDIRYWARDVVSDYIDFANGLPAKN